jgi:hypothetical protein
MAFRIAPYEPKEHSVEIGWINDLLLSVKLLMNGWETPAEDPLNHDFLAFWTHEHRTALMHCTGWRGGIATFDGRSAHAEQVKVIDVLVKAVRQGLDDESRNPVKFVTTAMIVAADDIYPNLEACKSRGICY